MQASTKRDLVRRGYDLLRWVEMRTSRSFQMPAGGFPPAPMHSSAETAEPVIALTFDDGPDPDLTPPLLDLLAERDVKATFYVIGKNVRRHPEIVRRAFDEGHEIGNHTWSHRFLTTQRLSSVIEELAKTDKAISDVIGQRVSSLRPPYGAITPSIAAWARHRFGYETVLWSVDSKDYDGVGSEEVVARVGDQAQSGSIVLLHDPVPATFQAMPGALDRLMDRGLRFAGVTDLLQSAATDE